MVKHPARGRDYDLRTALERFDLPVDRLSAIDRHDLDLRQEKGELPQLFGDLGAKLPGRAEDDRLHLVCLRVDLLDDRHAKCAGLAGPGGRLGNDLVSLHHHRDRFFLYLGHLGKSHPVNRFLNLF